MQIDGINTLQYEIIHKKLRSLFTWILTEIVSDDPREDIQALELNEQLNKAIKQTGSLDHALIQQVHAQWIRDNDNGG